MISTAKWFSSNVMFGVFFHRLDESALNLEARVVGMMENAKFGVSALAVEVERTVFILVEVHAPL